MTGDHAHPRLVAVWSGGPDAEGRRGFCSGLLIAPRLVLTCKHGVVDDAGASQSGAVIQMVTGPRGAVGLGEPLSARLVWAGAADLDASLLELPEGLAVPDGFLAGGLGWGELIGTRPVTVTASGMPSFAGRSTGRATEVETARGTVTPGTYAGSDRYAVDLTTGWPQGWKDWAGMSGAAVLCEASGCLVGVMAWSDTALEGRRLTAVPVSALLGEIGFREVIGRHLGRVPDTEPAELAPFLAHPHAAGSLGGLLRADAALVGFTGRTAEIRALERWRDQPSSAGPDVRALLVTARGGEGKTRLAVEFLARSKREGWTGGLLRPGLSAAHAGMTEVVAHPARRLLLVIDYAAAGPAADAGPSRRPVVERPRDGTGRGAART
jgi:hypothetical protein